MARVVAYAFPGRLYRILKRRPYVITATIACMAAMVGFLLYGLVSSLSLQIFGAWLAFFAIAGLCLISLGRLALAMVGRKNRHLPYYRTVAVCISLLVACICVPYAVGNATAVVGRVLEGAFVVTPQAVTGLENPTRSPAIADTLRRRATAVTTVYNFLTTGKTTIPSNGCYPIEDGRCVARTLPTTGGNGFWFVIIGTGSLLLSRALAEARAAMIAKRKGEPFAIIPYPKWVAACVYAAILAPATYCAIGSLLFLSLDRHESGLDALRQTLDRDEASALGLSPPVDINTTSLVAGFQPPLGAKDNTAKDDFESAVVSARAALTRLEAWRAGYKDLAVQVAEDNKKDTTAGEFQNYANLLGSQLSSTIVKNRTAIRTCLQTLGDIGVLNTNAVTSKTQPDTASLIARAKKQCDDATKMPLPGNDEAGGRVAKPQKAFYAGMYGWLSNAPPAAVRIVGLIGFGLFGAAISMMGRPDEAPYDFTDLIADEDNVNRNLREVENSRREAKVAREEADKANATLKALKESNTPPGAGAVEQAEKLATEKDAFARGEEAKLAEAARRHEAAQTMLDTKRRALVDDRNSIVVGRAVTNAQTGERATEYTISGAPARVVVHGLGAAFTVFLVGEAGVQLLSDGGETSAVGLLLACFIGAVFAQDIWGTARETLKRRTAAMKDGATPKTP